ncbi:hypothetical protein NM688_g1896 [Phlebia brevispora]|uniref:Uncharacterized protein n=1 Tax=Phlebia brevispora TaxID=194682 RepID=A0ACC1TA53_9APHY|nr:hypothetical protein NM688_g1896 [Phlebia brevispora]
MVRVAVAGGSGGIGQHIVDGILATKKHEVIVLSRSQSHADLESKGVKIAAVSYTDPTSLDSALQGVHTVISTIADIDGDVWVASQLALLEAAKRVGVKRFVPSDFAMRGVPDDPITLYGYKVPVEEAVRKSGLEYTTFETGVFMNYLVSGTPGVGYLQPLKFVIDVENCSAMVPGDGYKPIVMTRGEDVGTFVAASLDLPRWPEVCRMAGDRKTMKEITTLAEAARGKKFSVTYASAEDIEKRMDPSPSSSMTNFYMQVMLELIRTDRCSYMEANLSELCAGVKPMNIEDFLKEWWGKAD